MKERLEAAREEENDAQLKQPKMFEIRQGEEFKGINSLKKKMNKYKIYNLFFVHSIINMR